ncbi:FAD-dependent oxidoreductase [Conexibacter sp. SYSU D00693]|uniref:FAD-dependent oxidoreductase n=1 Tax=Conexibacter sp. SYSU D00693 TaxID=2812560 RepID=UPI001F11E00B|nr:FAD-dependent oxidoreductase [Conexibacter sp. SYSU D00693]
MSRGRLRVAIVGAGPAGAFTAAQLRARGDRFDIDVFDRLPTPWGLLRAGVAPDHGSIKTLDETFERATFAKGCRFFGNVEVGKDLPHAELARRYHAVVYAIGAQSDKSLGIPGEDLPGSMPATAFVGWYNGHPDFRDLAPDLSHETAVVIGNGNVAADVTRILTRSVEELARTDIADHALEALRSSRVRRVVVLGRRGPAQAAFTNAELRELGRMEGVNVVVRPDEAQLDPVSTEWLSSEGTFTARRNVEVLQQFAAQPPRPGAPREIELRFLRSPVAVQGDGRAERVELVTNELYRDDAGALRARALEPAGEVVEAGLVLRSVGYQAIPLPDVPFDERRKVLPNERGRVLDAATGDRLPGIYAVGWIKRGPTGILGTNKRDAAETVACLVEDWEAGALPEPAGGDVAEVLGGHADLVTADGWRAIDAHERSTGAAASRPRTKLASREELVGVARGT